jgi:hypothetical protein
MATTPSGIRALQAMSKSMGITAYCEGCGEKGDMGARHDGCGSYFMDNHPRINSRCATCGDVITGVWGTVCGECNNKGNTPVGALGHILISQTIDPTKIKTNEDREFVISEFLVKLDDKACIAVEVVGAGIQTIESAAELAEWLDDVDRAQIDK